MPLGISGLPVIAQLSDVRSELFKTSHNWDQKPGISTSEQIACWLGHKGLTVLSFPANVFEAGACALGFTAAACTLGTLKVAIFAATLGNVKPDFPTGCVWFGERALHGLVDLAANTGELAYDTGNAIYQGYRLARWAAGVLHMGHLFSTVFQELGRIFSFVLERLDKGYNQAAQIEDASEFSAPYPLSALDDLTDDYRIDFSSDERSLEDIFKHYVLSVLNIPLNAAAAVGGAGLSVALSTIFTAKVILYATTNIDIPLPTFAGQAIKTTIATSMNVITDISHDVADAFVLIYKLSEATGLNRVVVGAMRVVRYIPDALFG